MTVTAAAAGPVRAELLATADCQKLDVERKALIVLGIDKYIERGADWAKANLTVADLDLVRRYFDVFEQLKFRCEEDIGIIEVDEPDTVDGDDQQTASPGAIPPIPERRLGTAGASSATVIPSYTGSTEASAGDAGDTETNLSGGDREPRAVESTWKSNTTTIPKRPRQAAPIR